MIRFVSLVLIPLILVSLRLLRNGKKNWKVTVGTLASWMYADMYWMFFSFFFLSYACFNGIDFWICVNIFVKLTLRSHFRCLLLRSSDQEASPSAGKNTEVVFKPCRSWQFVLWCGYSRWSLVPFFTIDISVRVMKNYFKVRCLILLPPTFLILRFFNSIKQPYYLKSLTSPRNLALATSGKSRIVLSTKVTAIPLLWSWGVVFCIW